MNWIYEKGRIYSLGENNELLAEVTFVPKENGEVNINRTYVSPALRGQGIAGKMMEQVAACLREKKLRASATCSYANMWLKKYRDMYSDVISDDLDAEVIACKKDTKH